MSIIYEALKKVEAQGAKEPVLQKLKSRETKPKLKNIIIYILIIAAGIFLMNLFYKLISMPRVAAPRIKNVTVTANTAPAADKLNPAFETKASLPAKEPASNPNFNLNGVFYSGNEAYALLNNQIIKVGDTVGGAVVKRISLEGVELEKDGNLLQIPTNK